MTEVSCHVYRLKVSQDHTNSAVENNIELLPVLPSNYPVPIVDSAALFIINCLALSSIVVPSSFKKSRNTFNLRGHCLLVSGAFRAYTNTDNGSWYSSSSITANLFCHVLLQS